MKIIILICILIVINFTYVLGQNITPKIISTASDFIFDLNNSISFTIGEVATTTISGNSYTITQGFLQPQPKTNNVEKIGNITIKTYPNPVERILQMDIIYNGKNEFQIKIVNLLGNILFSHKISDSHFTHNFEKYPNGIYFINIISLDSEIYKTIKVTKQNK